MVFTSKIFILHVHTFLDIEIFIIRADVQISHKSGGARPGNLAGKMSDALIQFMKTGDPKGAGLPDGPKYTQSKCETMSPDDTCKVKNDSDREEGKSLPG